MTLATVGSDVSADVFISYSHADTKQAERLEEALRARGLSVWRDNRLHTEAVGKPYEPVIDSALRKATKVLVLWSPHSIKSKWVPAEAQRAYEQSKIVTVSLSECEKPLPFNTLHNLPFASSGPDLDLLLAALGAVPLAGQQGPALTLARPRVDTGRMPTTYARTLVGRDGELARLYRAWDSQQTNVFVIEAIGGAGKTTLMHHFVQGMQASGWRGAQRVYVWSFYSQGTDQKRTGSAHEFFEHALRWMGHKSEMPRSPKDRGSRLAELVRSSRTLLVLDGLEPLQYSTHSSGLAGKLRDEAMAIFFKDLASQNNGLCLVTTRIGIPDLRHFPPAVFSEPLARLSQADGVKLLKSLGVEGRVRAMNDLVEEYQGHALALTLVGRYLHMHHSGNIKNRRFVPAVSSIEGQDRNVSRVMRRYEIMYEERIKERVGEKLLRAFLLGSRRKEVEKTAAARQLGILRLLGLFDRPIETDALRLLRAKPAIPGLTEAIVELTEDEWVYAVAALRDLGLIAPAQKDKPHEIDAHALVREYFGNRLRETRPEAWREANGRLFRHYSDLAEERPKSLDAMEPLFRAIYHGCEAGRFEEAFRTYQNRLNRGPARFVVKEFGAHGVDLAALASFFAVPWSKLAPGVPTGEHAILLEWAGNSLTAFLRLNEAQQAYVASLAATGTDTATAPARRRRLRQLAEVQLKRGHLAEVEQTIQRIEQVETEIQGGPHPNELSVTSQRGHVALLRGDLQTAERLLDPLRLSGTLAGIRACDYRIAVGRHQEIIDRKHISTAYNEPENEGLIKLQQARAFAAAGRSADAAQTFEDAIRLIRELDSLDELPYTLLASSRFLLESGNRDEALRRLDEAADLIARGDMRLLDADAKILRAELLLGASDSGSIADAGALLNDAQRTIKQLGYLRAIPAHAVASARHAMASRDATKLSHALATLKDHVDKGWRCHEPDLQALRDKAALKN